MKSASQGWNVPCG